MMGFTISGPHGPIFSVCHAHGVLFSQIAAKAKLSLPATEKCATCGYRKVEKTKLVTFFHGVGKSLSMASAKLLGLDALRFVRASDTVFACLQALDEVQFESVEIVDDYVWCEAHAYR